MLSQFLQLLDGVSAHVFRRAESRRWARTLALGLLCALGRRTITRALWAAGLQHAPWAPAYKFFARSPWDAQAVFDPVLEHYLSMFADGPIVSAIDDTRRRKTGKKIRQVRLGRDPMSPRYRANLTPGLRFINQSLIFPFYRNDPDTAPWSIPVSFTLSTPAAKPKKKAPRELWQEYSRQAREHNLSTDMVARTLALRQRLDAAGAQERTLIQVGDGSLCNATIMSLDHPRIAMLVRCRKDCALRLRADPSSKRIYDPVKFTPCQALKDDSRPWKKTTVFYGGAMRQIRYKEVAPVLWQSATKRRPLRLIILAPTPYVRGAKTYYREPAFLLCTDLELDATTLIQAYLDRWQIEYNHRDVKNVLGVGQAQVRNELSVERQPAFAVACYSLLLLAALLRYGPKRTPDYLPLPAWRNNAKRPSILDLLGVLRNELEQQHKRADFARAFHGNARIYAYT